MIITIAIGPSMFCASLENTLRTITFKGFNLRQTLRNRNVRHHQIDCSALRL
jgi:hypothetical protein